MKMIFKHYAFIVFWRLEAKHLSEAEMDYSSKVFEEYRFRYDIFHQSCQLNGSRDVREKKSSMKYENESLKQCQAITV